MLVPLSDGRALISFDESMTPARIELKIEDALEDDTLTASRRRSPREHSRAAEGCPAFGLGHALATQHHRARTQRQEKSQREEDPSKVIQVLKEKTLVKKGTIFLMMLAIWAGGGQKARAQDELVPTGFINIDAGAQPQRQTITATNSFPLYDETATVTVTQRIRNGAVYDVSGGMRIAHNLAAGVGFSQFGRDRHRDRHRVDSEPEILRPAAHRQQRCR